jgi:hypothetical protein
VAVNDIEGARSALRAGEPADLLGLAESDWLEVKSGIYQLDDPGGAEELGKDVAALANANADGLLLVGFSTRKEHDAEILDGVRPVPRNLVDLDRHRKLIRERVIPPPRDVKVEWVDCTDGKGLLVIDVPSQPPARLPHVVLGATTSANVGRPSVAVPIREGDAVAWLPPNESQRLLAAGWTAMGGPSKELLADLIGQAVTAHRDTPPSRPEIEIGEGELGWKGPFQQSWSDLMSRGIWIGHPANTVYWDGPGVVQHFESSASQFGWILCCLPNRRPVAVAGGIWQALQAAGSGVPAATLRTPIIACLSPGLGP